MVVCDIEHLLSARRAFYLTISSIGRAGDQATWPPFDFARQIKFQQCLGQVRGRYGQIPRQSVHFNRGDAQQ